MGKAAGRAGSSKDEIFPGVFSMKTVPTRMLPFVTCALVLVLSAAVSNRAADDWPQWRGTNRDGRSAERGLLKTWST
jgi:hypothetical protein